MQIEKERLATIINEETGQTINEFLGGMIKYFSPEERKKRLQQSLGNAFDQMTADADVSPELRNKVLTTVLQDPNHMSILKSDLDQKGT